MLEGRGCWPQVRGVHQPFLVLQIAECLLDVLVQLVKVRLDLGLAVLHWVLKKYFLSAPLIC
jgi:hypothetical protein